MPSKRADKFMHVMKCVSLQGTTSPTHIQRYLKSRGVKITRGTISRYVQELSIQNDAWINSQASMGWLNTIREIYAAKRERLELLDLEMRNCKQSRTKGYLAQVLNETEESLTGMMENGPLYMIFTKRMQVEKEDPIIAGA